MDLEEENFKEEFEALGRTRDFIKRGKEVKGRKKTGGVWEVKRRRLALLFKAMGSFIV